MEQPPPPVQMVQMLAGFQVSQALYAATRLGVPDQLADGPRTAAEVGTSLAADPGSVARLSRILTGLGVLTQPSPGTYGDNDVRIAPGSRLAELIGTEATWACHHHQAVDGLGAGLTPVAWASDGTV